MLISPEEINKSLSSKDWKYIDKKICKSYSFTTYMEGIEFVQNIAVLAEKQNHHPDLDIRYNKIKCRVMSHDVSSITDRDFNLAQVLKSIY